MEYFQLEYTIFPPSTIQQTRTTSLTPNQIARRSYPFDSNFPQIKTKKNNHC